MTLIEQLSTKEEKTFLAALNVIYKDSTGNLRAYNKAHVDLEEIQTAHNWTGGQLQQLIEEYKLKFFKK